jgi:hypothetical protein
MSMMMVINTLENELPISTNPAANGTAGTYTVSASATGVASPAKFSLTNTDPANTPSTPAVASLAAAPSPEQANDQVLTELGRTWDFLLAAGNVHVLQNNPPALSLANAIDPNPLYQTSEGWLMANALAGSLLAGYRVVLEASHE